MEFAAGARVAPRPLAAGSLPARDRRVGGGAIGIALPRRADAPRLSLPPAVVARRAASAAGGGCGHLLPRRVAVVRSAGGGDGAFHGGEDIEGEGSSPARSSLPDVAARNSAGDHPGGIRRELMGLAVPAIVGQAIDPVAQLLETAYIGRLGPVELASAAVGVSVFNIISKLFNIPLLSITTSFVAEDVSKHDSSQPASGNMSSEIGERKRLPSISSALLLAAAIGVIEALALILGSGILLNIMGVSQASAMHNPARLFLSVRALGAPAVVVSLAIQGVFRGLKDTKTPLLYSGLGNISAVVLLPFFVYSLKLGLTGAALATIASQYLGMFLLLWSLSRRAVLLPPKIKDLEFVGYIKSGEWHAIRENPFSSNNNDSWDCNGCSARHTSYGCSPNMSARVIVGIALALLLSASFGRIAEVFSKDPMVIQIVRSGVLFVSASQPINALAFIFDGLHYGISDFSYSASSMMIVGALSSLCLLYAPQVFGLPGVWAGLALFMSLRMTAGFMSPCDVCLIFFTDWDGEQDLGGFCTRKNLDTS
ncbi:Protein DETOXIFICATION 45, chloroplastic [Dichanthelium oligosanthes]|uniref:Protein DETOXIFICATION n=1 Tax=Dichanthelium oligosanthes TaxID=888268 RepID=A0A1E5UP61_9POAL|nr:Protein DETOXIFICATION 45, chloroplastic [Dichanthelium oligosanthes]